MIKIAVALSAAQGFGAVQLNTSWLPGMIEGLVGAFIIFIITILLRSSKRWVTDWFTTLLAHTENVGHDVKAVDSNTKANGLDSDTAGDTSKRTENVVAVMFRVMLAKGDFDEEALPGNLKTDVEHIKQMYGISADGS